MSKRIQYIGPQEEFTVWTEGGTKQLSFKAGQAVDVADDKEADKLLKRADFELAGAKHDAAADAKKAANEAKANTPSARKALTPEADE